MSNIEVFRCEDKVGTSFGVFAGLFVFTLLMGLASTSISNVSASTSANASVNVSAACTMSSVVDTAHTATINPDTNQPNIGQTSVTVTCNDPGGYAIYAIGYSGTPSTLGNTDLINTVSSSLTIATGTATSGGTSNWSMKLAPGTASASSKAATIITTPIDYSNYANVPSSYDKVATFASTTDGTGGSSFTTTYQAYIGHNQPAGTYDGKVKYTLVHPNNAPDPGKIRLYDAVAAQLKTNSSACSVKTADNKCSQDSAGLKAVITTPTSSDPSQDTSNSGVFAYNESVFGTASDASNTNTIYYFRGILDSNIDPSSSASPNYGSNGDSAYYQNYARLGDTCWRIFRTTGSGGVKMIYNGSYSGGTTANSCANAQYDTQLTSIGFNSSTNALYTGLEYHNMHAVGYTYSNIAAGTTTSIALSTLLGSSGNDTTTNANSSSIKQYIETGWYQQNMTSYTNILEPNAGYCADRTVFDDTSPYTQQAESTTVIPYGDSSTTIQYYFGAKIRNTIDNGTRTLTLTCPRGRVDTYSTTTASGGNGQLTYPVALITVDEAALSGSGGNGRTSTATQASNYSYGSFLRSGSSFWLLSPNYRSRYGAGGFYLAYDGRLVGTTVGVGNGVRPSISLKAGTVASSGSGIATDPWVVDAP